ncbi:MAG: nucleotidyltransferase domain-containing protein [Chlamydiia bacterium]|nr:nucleotidyltransferase domain-containing protein [Chlamydiia bacterium]
MRLDQNSCEEICAAISRFIPTGGALYLYGSRTDPSKRGGDIDLLLVVEDQAIREKLQRELYKILVEIKRRIGDQRIDLSVVSPTLLEEDPFYRSIFPDSILLAQW